MKTILAIAVSLVLTAFSAVCDAAPESSQPVYTNKNRFRIPYRYDAEEMHKISAREIRLYVSLDRGNSWKHAQSVAPVAGRFEFQAPRDGEYWFAVRTLDSRNQIHPGGTTIQPGLKVIVDTKQPSLTISLKPVESGRVQLEWSAVDDHIDPTTLQLEYIQSGWQSWKRVAVTPQAAGRTSWKIVGGGIVAVRGRISDTASNEVSTQNQIPIVPVQQSSPKPSVLDFSQPIAANERNRTQSLKTPNPSRAPQESLPPLPEESALKQRTALSQRPFLAGSGSASTGNEQRARKAPEMETRITSRLPAGATSPVLNTPEQSPSVADQSKSPVSGSTRPSLRISSNTRVVNTHKFHIGYRIDDTGPSAVGVVELFITQNGGQKWYQYGNDKDLKSPFEVEVPQDGHYGFTLRARNGLGVGSNPPQPGEEPSINVIVDKTPPVAQLYPIQQGRGTRVNKIAIKWKMTDAYPNERPISLSYASDSQGPWEPISGWIPNTGSFTWSTGPGIPSKLYIRLIARDAAGNVSKVASTNPVIVDLSKPVARIVDVKSVKPSGVR